MYAQRDHYPIMTWRVKPGGEAGTLRYTVGPLLSGHLLSFLYGTRAVLISNLRAFENKKKPYDRPDQKRTNQNARISRAI